MGTHRASLDLRPPTAVLAERWEEALRGGRPSLQGDGGRPFQSLPVRG